MENKLLLWKLISVNFTYLYKTATLCGLEKENVLVSYVFPGLVCFLKETPVKVRQNDAKSHVCWKDFSFGKCSIHFCRHDSFQEGGVCKKREAFQTWDMKNPLRISWTPPRNVTAKPRPKVPFSRPQKVAGNGSSFQPWLAFRNGRIRSLSAMPSRYPLQKTWYPVGLLPPPPSRCEWRVHLKLEVWFYVWFAGFHFGDGNRFYVLFSTMAKQNWKPPCGEYVFDFFQPP